MPADLPPLGLYIHLPWCERKCPYCDFNSHETQHIPERDYVDALLRDLDGEVVRAHGRRVDTLFIGGGTPSLFSAEAIGTLLAGVRNRLSLAHELEATMEANPGSAEADKFAGFRAAGINRLSLGIQSFCDEHLRGLGRIHSVAQARAALGMARAAGFVRLNIDLMHGLPGQGGEGACEDLRQALSFAPSHLSWYQLTIEPNTVFHKRPPPLPPEETLATIEGSGAALLSQSGLRQYEVSAWSMPGEECRHNLNYWRFGDYLAIGAGAHGKITHRPGRIERYAKRRQPADYLRAASGRFDARQRWLDDQELPGEYMMNALRLRAGTTLAAFSANTGLEPAVIRPQLEELAGHGLVELINGRVRCTELGWRHLDTVVAAFC